MRVSVLSKRGRSMISTFILIDQWRKQCEFDELERMARRFNRRHRPDAILIEKMANGPALISKLRRKLK